MTPKFETLDNLILNPLDYDYGFLAIRNLLHRLELVERELADEIENIEAIAAKSSCLANELAVDEWVDRQ